MSSAHLHLCFHIYHVTLVDTVSRVAGWYKALCYLSHCQMYPQGHISLSTLSSLLEKQKSGP